MRKLAPMLVALAAGCGNALPDSGRDLVDVAMPALAPCDVRDAECAAQIVDAVAALYDHPLPAEREVAVVERAPASAAPYPTWEDAIPLLPHVLGFETEPIEEAGLALGLTPDPEGDLVYFPDTGLMRFAYSSEVTQPRRLLAGLVSETAKLLRELTEPGQLIDAWTEWPDRAAARWALRRGVASVLLLRVEEAMAGTPERAWDAVLAELDGVLATAADPAVTPERGPTNDLLLAAGTRAVATLRAGGASWADTGAALSEQGERCARELLGGPPCEDLVTTFDADAYHSWQVYALYEPALAEELARALPTEARVPAGLAGHFGRLLLRFSDSATGWLDAFRWDQRAGAESFAALLQELVAEQLGSAAECDPELDGQRCRYAAPDRATALMWRDRDVVLVQVGAVADLALFEGALDWVIVP